jgi:hypothetical protein
MSLEWINYLPMQTRLPAEVDVIWVPKQTSFHCRSGHHSGAEVDVILQFGFRNVFPKLSQKSHNATNSTK